MSRVGKNAINVPNGVTVNINNGLVEVSGKLGKLSMPIVDSIVVTREDSLVKVAPANDGKLARMNWGTTQRRIANMISDVSEGAVTNLELEGVGYKASVQGRNLILQLGFSHDVVYPLPEGINIVCSKPTSLVVSGHDRQHVGQVVAEICKYRPPEPYKGKGIRKVGQIILRKEGKKK